MEYAGLEIPTAVVPVDGVVRARLTVSNTGPRPALETVQIYVTDVVTSVTWAEKELKGYRQVHLEPGATQTLELELPAAACTLVDQAGRRVVEPGTFQLLVGRSSKDEDLLSAEFTVAG